MKHLEISETDMKIYELCKIKLVPTSEVAVKYNTTAAGIRYIVKRVENRIKYNKTVNDASANPDNVYNLDLDTITLNYLIRAGYTSMKKIQLAAANRSLLKARGIGPKNFAIIKEQVDDYIKAHKAELNLNSPSKYVYEHQLLFKLALPITSTPSEKKKCQRVLDLLKSKEYKTIIYALDENDDVLASSPIAQPEFVFDSKSDGGLEDFSLTIDTRIFNTSGQAAYVKKLVFGIVEKDLLGLGVDCDELCNCVFAEPVCYSDSVDGVPITAVITRNSIYIN